MEVEIVCTAECEKNRGIIITELIIYVLFNVVSFILTLIGTQPAIEYVIGMTGKKYFDECEDSKNKLDCGNTDEGQDIDDG